MVIRVSPFLFRRQQGCLVPRYLLSWLVRLPSVGVYIMDDSRASSRRRRRWKAKGIKTLSGKFCYVLGHDIFMDRVTSLCSRALVGTLEYYHLGKKDWVDWETAHWKPLLGIYSDYQFAL